MSKYQAGAERRRPFCHQIRKALGRVARACRFARGICGRTYEVTERGGGVYAEEVRKMRSGKPVAGICCALVVSFATMNAMPSDTLLAALLQEAVLALVALVAVGLAVPDAFKRCTQTVQQRSIVRFTAITLLLVGLVGGAITLLAWLFAGGGTMACFASTALPSTADLMENLLILLGICLLTGLYEESFMRVLGIEAFERRWIRKRAILASAALFALLHVGAPTYRLASWCFCRRR